MTANNTNFEDNFNPALVLPSLLALLFMLGVAGLVWLSQVRPAGGEAAAASAAPTVAAAPAMAVTGDAAAGQQLFAGTCSACHGPTGQGIPGLGKDVTTSQFVAGQSDADLMAFIKVGRSPTDPLNTTGVSMPPKGGNPSLDDQDLANVVAYIRTIRK